MTQAGDLLNDKFGMPSELAGLAARSRGGSFRTHTYGSTRAAHPDFKIKA
jgi:hypothetical protein